jgi:hypothetical protein
MDNKHFNKWFETSFGKKPKGNIGKLQKEYRLAVSRMMQVELELRQIDMWQQRRDAAVKAWDARRKNEN